MYRSTRLIICQIYIQQAILYVSFGHRQYANPHKQSIVKCQTRTVSLTYHGRSNIINYKKYTKLMTFYNVVFCQKTVIW